MPVLASAQTYPDPTSTDINDFAGLLVDAEVRDTLRTRLVNLRQATGVEMTVVTLATQKDFAPNLSLEAFATGLFNSWGIGDASRNDGVLVLVLRDDRAMRVELGAGYAQDWNDEAARVVGNEFLPHFREGDYQSGISSGSAAVIDTIVVPFLAGKTGPAKTDEGQPWYMVLIFGVIFLGIMLRNVMGDFVVRFRTCPQCGRKGTLRATRRTIVHASSMTPGSAERTVTCTACDYHDLSTIYLPRRSSASDHSSSSSGSGFGGGFGGGRSGGGGASGRW
ncbi:YgcG family protein [uncultured Tateyamaria sp.]|uniref:TPM domain-containing protein n=1 Tax=uncultured Tateyamaria sp. TaxID=455651 RepID=UPI00260B668D|nr:TPM domain-containing protein [uncultured Tateyamaria sp.]